MIKNSGYFLSRIVPYLRKKKDKKIILKNENDAELSLLYYLGFEIDKYISSVNNFSKIYSKEIKEEGDKRIWIEKKIQNYPHLVNTLWMFDYKKISPTPDKINPIPLSNNLSYSRPEVLEFDTKVYKEYKPKVNKCVILPCSTSKPYHKRKYKKPLKFTKIAGSGKYKLQQMIENPDYENIVLTSLGIIPEQFWEDEVVLNYDTGARDLWKLLCITKQFFLKNSFEEYQVYVKFKPYRDIIRNIVDMGVIDKNKIKFIGEDDSPSKPRIIYYPKEYKLYELNEEI